MKNIFLACVLGVILASSAYAIRMNDLTVERSAVFKGSVTYNSPVTQTVDGLFKSTSAATLSGTSVLSGATTLSGATSISGALTISSAMTSIEALLKLKPITAVTMAYTSATPEGTMYYNITTHKLMVYANPTWEACN